MASAVTDEQAAKLAKVVQNVGDIKDAAGLRKVVVALESSDQTVFSREQLETMEAGIGHLDLPLQSRPCWEAEQGRGRFFVFEGLDRSGKSTQSRKLREHLETTVGADKVKWMCFPDRDTPIGMLIDLYLRRKIELSDGAIHLLFSANRWELSRSIVASLNEGVTVVCDRYAFSGVAYTTAKGLDFEWSQSPDRGLPCPDGVFFMRVDPEVGASRASFGDERYENQEFQTLVRKVFLDTKLHACVPWHTIDGDRDIEEIHKEIKSKADTLSQGSNDIVRLWYQ